MFILPWILRSEASALFEKVEGSGTAEWNPEGNSLGILSAPESDNIGHTSRHVTGSRISNGCEGTLLVE